MSAARKPLEIPKIGKDAASLQSNAGIVSGLECGQSWWCEIANLRQRIQRTVPGASGNEGDRSRPAIECKLDGAHSPLHRFFLPKEWRFHQDECTQRYT